MLTPFAHLLAQVPQHIDQKVDSIWDNVLFLVVILLLVPIVVFAIKAWMKSQQDYSHDAGSPFSLEDLRQMHLDGQIDDEQYERARSRILALHGDAEIEDASEDDGITDISHEFTEDNVPDNDDNGPDEKPDRA